MGAVKIILLGDSYTGKTTLIKQKILKVTTGVLSKKFLSYTATGYENNNVKLDYNGKCILGIIMDFSGQNKSKDEKTMNNIKSTKACGLVFDLTDPNTFTNIDEWKKYYMDIQKEPNFILIGTKCDLEKQIKVEYAKIYKWCRDNAINGKPIKYFQVSAKEYIFVDEVFNALFNYGSSEVEENRNSVKPVIRKNPPKTNALPKSDEHIKFENDDPQLDLVPEGEEDQIELIQKRSKRQNTEGDSTGNHREDTDHSNQNQTSDQCLIFQKAII